MSTSVLSIVLASTLLAGQSSAPAWQNDYAKAQQQASAQKMPLVIVFGSGANGWTKVVREAAPSADVTKLMSDRYVNVYVDVASPAGKALAQNFDITGNVGVVISDKTGSMQAFWHQGDMASIDLARYLEKYADGNVSVRSTETMSTTSRTSLYPPNGAGVNLDPTAPPFQSYCPSCNNARSRR
jgi:hypothetical protein